MTSVKRPKGWLAVWNGKNFNIVSFSTIVLFTSLTYIARKTFTLFKRDLTKNLYGDTLHRALHFNVSFADFDPVLGLHKKD